MGTRSLTFVYDSYKTPKGKVVNEPIINFYRQYDGYPTGHGAELAEFLTGGKMTNGLRFGDEGKFFNGMGDLAAQLVAHFKQESGGFYLYPVTAKDCGQDFEYHIYKTDDGFKIIVMNCGVNFFGMTNDSTYEEIFNGSLVDFVEFCKETEEA